MVILEEGSKYRQDSGPTKMEEKTIGIKTCRKCHTTFSFESSEVDNQKIIPHIICPKCKKSVQLNESWYQFFKRKEG